MFKNITMLLLFTTILVGCSNNTKKDQEITNLANQLNTALSEIEYYRNKLDENETVNNSTIKKSFHLKLKVIEKISEKSLIIASFEDEDHNTPLAIYVAKDSDFEDLEINKTYNFEVYFIFVIEGEQLRFEASLLDYN